jgi:membrane protein YdbS with pleckstrin-like domain
MKTILLVIACAVILFLVVLTAVFVMELVFTLIVPKEHCRVCRKEMDIDEVNFLTGEVVHRCPHCGRSRKVKYDNLM